MLPLVVDKLTVPELIVEPVESVMLPPVPPDRAMVIEPVLEPVRLEPISTLPPLTLL